MGTPLRVLIVEDSESDAQLLLRQLRQAGFDPVHQQVETAEAMRQALRDRAWDLIICDYTMPEFDAPTALALAQDAGLDIPFFVVSGSIGEDIAVTMMKRGAHDYLLKGNLTRLSAAVARELREAEGRRVRRAAEATLRLHSAALEAAANAIVLTDSDGRITWANPAFTRLTGYSLSEIRGQNLRFLKSGRHDPPFYGKMWESLLSGQVWHGEVVNQRKDGSLYTEDMTVTPVRDNRGEISHFIAVKQDITERKQATERLARVNRELRTISVCNQALVRASSEEELLREICQVIVDVGEHRAAWVGLVEEAGNGDVRQVAVVGCEPERVDRHAMKLADPVWKTCPVGLAIRTGIVQVVHDIPGNPSLCPWHEEAVRLGVGSSIALPLKDGEHAFGALTIYSVLLDAFEADEVRLLCELADDLAYGIQAIRTRAAHTRALAEIEGLARFPNENPNPVMRVREDGTILYANARSEPLLRWWNTIVGEHVPAEWGTRVREVLGTNAQEVVDLPCDERIYSVVVAPVPEGNYVNLYCLDITERKRAEDRLRAEEERFRLAAESLSDVLYEWDIGSRIEWFGAIDALLGYPPGEFPRTLEAWVDILHPEDRERVWAAVERHLNNEAGYDIEYRVRRRDGAWRHWLARGKALRDASDKPYRWVGAITDITDRKRLEVERTHLEAQLRQQQKLEAIGTLASGVAHEINNPITGIMNYAQLIADTSERGSQAAGYAGEILHETERVATIVRNLLHFARQEKQSHSLARIADILERTLSLLRAVLRRDQITLEVDVPEGLPSLKCRSQQIQQVLMNLLTNARDALNERYPGYHEDKKIAITVRELGIADLRLPISDLRNQGTAGPQSQIANRKSQMANRWLRITVEDHGAGIPEDIRERIFDPFFTTKPRDKGTGLGLSISHGIVKDHHGRLHFETEPGTGTRFHLDLPVEEK